MNAALTEWRVTQLPWQPSAEEERRFRTILLGAMAAFLVLALIIPQLPVAPGAKPKSDPARSLTKITLEKRELPPVKPKPQVVQPKPKPKPKTETPRKTRKPETSPRKQSEVVEKPPPVDPLVQARKAAAVAGVLAFQDDLKSLRDSVDVNTLNQTRTSRGVADAAELQRSVIASTARASSGGIKTAPASTDTGGRALAARHTTQVQSDIAGTPRGTRATAPAVQSSGRSDESIRRVMDKNKGAIFAIYNRALRKDPLLEGKLVFEMLIDAKGDIVELKLLSSGLGDAALTRKILARINLIQFGSENVTATRVNYSFDFLPYS